MVVHCPSGAVLFAWLTASGHGKGIDPSEQECTASITQKPGRGSTHETAMDLRACIGSRKMGKKKGGAACREQAAVVCTLAPSGGDPSTLFVRLSI